MLEDKEMETKHHLCFKKPPSDESGAKINW